MTKLKSWMRRISRQWAGGKVHGLDIGLSYRRRLITCKIRVAQKIVIEEKMLEIKRSIRRGILLRYISFPDSEIRSGHFSV